MNCPSCHCPRGEPLTVATNSLVTRCHNAFHAVAVSPARPDDFATETAKDTTPPPPQHRGAAKTAVGVYCPVHGQDRCSHVGECMGLVCLAQVHGEAKVVVCTGCGSSDGGHPLDCPTRVEFPYTTPIPTAHDGATGWVFCSTCESPQPVSGHECDRRPPGWVRCFCNCHVEGSGVPPCDNCGVCLALIEEESEAIDREAMEIYATKRTEKAMRLGRNAFGMYRRERERAEFAEDILNRLAFIHGCDHMEPDIYDDARAVAVRQGNYGGWTWPLHAPGECVFCDAARGGGR